jgi:hypothetical protein
MKTIAIAFGTLVLGLAAAQAATYPVSGKWGYDSSSGDGRIDCKNRATVEFAGDRRFETGGKAPPDYRNVSVDQINPTTFRVVDLFFTGMQQGNVVYVLSIVDPDRIEMTHTMSGSTFRLRRCN